MLGFFFIVLIIIFIIIGAIHCQDNKPVNSVNDILSKKPPRNYARTSLKKQTQKLIHLIVRKNTPNSKCSIICPSCNHKANINKDGKGICPVCHHPLHFL